MKYEAHVQPKEFEFIGFSDFEGTAEEAYGKYLELKEIVKPKPVKTMEEKKFCEIIDLMIEKKPIHEDPGILEEMNETQSSIFHAVRKSLGRIKYKNR